METGDATTSLHRNMINTNDQMTPREHLEHEWRTDEFKLQADHATQLKRLDLEVAKLDAKWATWIKIPLTIIKLPIYALFGIGFIVSMITKVELPENFWNFIR